MKAGRPTSLLLGKIDYKQLRKVNPEAARLSVLEYLGANGHNISQAASVFGISRSVVYDILRKRFVVPIMLDKTSVAMGPWSGYHVLARHLVGALAPGLIS